MNKKKIISTVLAGTMALSMFATPVFAANDAQAVIDTNRTGTINIHKLIENDGNNQQAYGLADPDESRIPVNNIGFDYVQLATIENVRGIVISDADGINWDADGGEVSVGAYYKGNAALDNLIGTVGIVPVPTWVKTSVVDPDSAPTIQYEFNDNKAANALSAEQAAVDAKAETLRQKAEAMNSQARAYAAATSTSNQASTKRELAQQALTAANQALADANAALTEAQGKLTEANDAVTAAQTAYDEANQALTEAAEAKQTAEEAYKGAGDDSTQNLLNTASAEFDAAREAASTAASRLASAISSQAEAQTAYDNALAAKNAAQDILDTATAAHNASAAGLEDSIEGTLNAVTYATEALENANAYLAQVETALNAANDELDAANTASANAQEALSTAQDNLSTAMDNDSAAYAAYSNALALMNAAQTELDNAQKALENATAAQTAATTARDDAQDAVTAAQADVAAKQEAFDNADATATTSGNNNTAAQDAYNTARSEWETALADYNTAVSALNTAAAGIGVERYYTAESLQNMMKEVLATTKESVINEWVRANTNYSGDPEGKHTDDNGVVSFSGLPLGLYMVAETDDTYHDGIAGAWNDRAEGGYINNDQMNTYDSEGYHITPIDAFSQDKVHDYVAGEVYTESINPEFPVIDNAAAPFLVSVPTTNAIDTTANDVAAGDQYGEAGTVWQYTIDVYPKNQTTAIQKAIIDPDEAIGSEILRTSEDYQIGDVIDQYIWAEVPALQPNYLDTDATNTHKGLVLTDNMTAGLTLKEIESVYVIPGAQIKGENVNEVGYIYFDPDGGRCSAEEALVDPSNPATSALNTRTKYYDAENHEISAEEYANISALNRGAGRTETVSYKKYIANGASYTGATALTADKLALGYDGLALTSGTDYTFIDIEQAPVVMKDAAGNEQVVVEQNAFHGWAVQLTDAGLAKLDAFGKDAIIVVRFTSNLNEKATIGQAKQNMNYASMHWINSNMTEFKKISSNEVYDYTYELILKKEGVSDATNVKFVISRTDAGDFRQADEKSLTDTVSGVQTLGQDDSMRFVKESEGVYHVWDGTGEAEVTEINGSNYYTLTPAKDGTLKIKGLDSNEYTFKEVQTEAGKNLLKDTFTVTLKANDCTEENPYDSMRDGRIDVANVYSGSDSDRPIDITIGGADAAVEGGKNLGIASLAVNNYNIVDLRTGGAGRTMILVIGGALMAAMGIGIVAVNRKKKNEAE